MDAPTVSFAPKTLLAHCLKTQRSTRLRHENCLKLYLFWVYPCETDGWTLAHSGDFNPNRLHAIRNGDLDDLRLAFSLDDAQVTAAFQPRLCHLVQVRDALTAQFLPQVTVAHMRGAQRLFV